MRDMPRADGATAIFGDDDQEQIIVEPIITGFLPVRGNSRCICGATLQPSSFRCVTPDGAELGCTRCHRVHGYFHLATRSHR
jgi:hypothetical protein